MRIGSLRIEHPIVQPGMGGGLACHGLAIAVSEAGGLGTIGILSPGRLRTELQIARDRTSKPIAVNLLLPFTHGAHWEIAAQADAVVTFWGRPQRHTAGTWIHQCGSVEEAIEARDAGADGVVVQGIEAGGHVRGELPALELLARARRALPPQFPILVAGGIATASDVRAAVNAGAEAAVLGTRFLMSDESGAHLQYKRRLTQADHTILTDLFSLGWPARHRVVPNAATKRWGARAPAWIQLIHQLSGPLAGMISLDKGSSLASVQRPWFPLLSPKAPTSEDAASLVDAAPLYAGETVARIHDILPAATIMRELVG